MNDKPKFENASGETYIMKRTNILCPSCFKKKIIEETKNNGYCDGCGQTYTITGENSLKFK